MLGPRGPKVVTFTMGWAEFYIFHCINNKSTHFSLLFSLFLNAPGKINKKTQSASLNNFWKEQFSHSNSATNLLKHPGKLRKINSNLLKLLCKNCPPQKNKKCQSAILNNFSNSNLKKNSTKNDAKNGPQISPHK